MPRLAKVTALTACVLLIWSALFASTFRSPFFWDDYHLIRHYNVAETLSAFHAVIDPDKIETPGLRPCSIFLYNFQGSVFGENVVAHHIFMVAFVGIFMVVAGSLLVELGLSFAQLAVVFVLFVSSRIFASLVLWISLSHLILAYIWIALTAYLFVLWAKRGCWLFFFFMLIAATLATFTREETYTLPIVLPLLWMICFFDAALLRRVATGALAIFAIVCFHYWLWHFLVPDAISPRLNFGAAKRVFIAIAASLLPRGYQCFGQTEMLIAVLWIIFLIGLVAMLAKLGGQRARWQFFGVCAVGVLLCLPALAIGRPFGITLPTLTFLTAISMALGEIYTQLQTRSGLQRWQRATIVGLAVGLAVGIGGGIQRSFYVAESLRPNCARRAMQDGQFIFDVFDRPTTIPPQRRQAGLARLEHFGIHSADDVRRLESALKKTGTPAELKPFEPALFVSKYDYLSF